MLNAAQEAVVMAIDGLAIDRVLATAGLVGLKAQPPLSTFEVMTLAGGLALEGYLRVEDDGAGSTYYELTSRGRNYVGSVVARGT